MNIVELVVIIEVPMEIIKQLYSRFKNLKFGNKLLLSYTMVIFIPIILISWRFYNIHKEDVSRLARQNVYEILKKSNAVIDEKLSKAEESSFSIIRDRELYDAFSTTDNIRVTNILEIDRKVSSILQRYFNNSPNVYSSQLATSYYTFGNNTSLISGENYKNSELYSAAVNAKGSLQWIPTYDFTVMFSLNKLNKIKLEDRYIFSAVRLINSFYLNNYTFSMLESSIERPTLIINFRESLFKNVFNNSFPFTGTEFYVISKEGLVVSSSQKQELTKIIEPVWFEDALQETTGTKVYHMKGKDIIVCYDTSKVTGWISAVIVPADALMSSFLLQIRNSTLFIVGIFLIISFLLAILISNMISKPIKKLLNVMRRMEKGDFSERIPVNSRDEFGYFIERFNALNERIRILIEENYEVRIREKETEIMALNLQLNPHFLYNTLNIMNWMAIEAGQKNISDLTIALCDMLAFTIRDKKDIVAFEDDFKWLQQYLQIMSYRYEDKFDVEFDIDPRLFRQKVPKLFLQPFVENAIMHGFDQMENGGVIRIIGHIKDDEALFMIQDNGMGMSPERLESVMNIEYSSIGVRNVDKRVRLLFGEEYCVRIESEQQNGTIVKVRLPLSYV